MNTLNNKIAIPDIPNIQIEEVIGLFTKAKNDGFTMIVLNGKVYSIGQILDSKQNIGYLLEYYALFDVNDFEVTGPGSYFTVNEPAPTIKFKRDFETLYNVAMKMADECIGARNIEARFSKLEEEYQELVVEFSKVKNADSGYWPVDNFINIRGEMADLLFVLLHIAHKKNITPFTLLHQASSKMLERMADPNYKAKN